MKGKKYIVPTATETLMFSINRSEGGLSAAITSARKNKSNVFCWEGDGTISMIWTNNRIEYTK